MSRHVAWNWFESCIDSFAKLAKSLARYAASIAFIRPGTTCAARCAKRGEVSTEVCMPAVEETAFFVSETTNISTCSSGQWSAGPTIRAFESEPSAAEPISHATKPPCRLRHAEPEPMRASVDSSPSYFSSTPCSLASAKASAA